MAIVIILLGFFVVAVVAELLSGKAYGRFPMSVVQRSDHPGVYWRRVLIHSAYLVGAIFAGWTLKH